MICELSFLAKKLALASYIKIVIVSMSPALNATCGLVICSSNSHEAIDKQFMQASCLILPCCSRAQQKAGDAAFRLPEPPCFVG